MGTSKNDILQGTLTLLVLKTLASNKRMHGYAITTHVQRVSADLLRVEEGSLYPALHRMEQQGWLKSEWGVTEKNREARFYSLTAQGRKQLAHRGRELGAFHRRRRPRAPLRLIAMNAGEPDIDTHHVLASPPREHVSSWRGSIATSSARLSFHMAERADQLQAQGLSREEAHAARSTPVRQPRRPARANSRRRYRWLGGRHRCGTFATPSARSLTLRASRWRSS